MPLAVHHIAVAVVIPIDAQVAGSAAEELRHDRVDGPDVVCVHESPLRRMFAEYFGLGPAEQRLCLPGPADHPEVAVPLYDRERRIPDVQLEQIFLSPIGS